ncbi:hypothetical protein GOV09_04765 [Candidatus Woesearchaeota archaeon]|nr:hypothetical protein [Candidatus Woesearchaeota archaeon]
MIEYMEYTYMLDNARLAFAGLHVNSDRTARLGYAENERRSLQARLEPRGELANTTDHDTLEDLAYLQVMSEMVAKLNSGIPEEELYDNYERIYEELTESCEIPFAARLLDFNYRIRVGYIDMWKDNFDGHVSDHMINEQFVLSPDDREFLEVYARLVKESLGVLHNLDVVHENAKERSIEIPSFGKDFNTEEKRLMDMDHLVGVMLKDGIS